jgi:ribosome-associated protein
VYEAVTDKKAINPVVLEVAEFSSFTDYFIICGANSPQQMKALADAVLEKFKNCGVRQEHQEGMSDSAWILLDYGDFIVHIFTAEARLFYNLEQLWHNAPRLEL